MSLIAFSHQKWQVFLIFWFLRMGKKWLMHQWDKIMFSWNNKKAIACWQMVVKHSWVEIDSNISQSTGEPGRMLKWLEPGFRLLPGSCHLLRMFSGSPPELGILSRPPASQTSRFCLLVWTEGNELQVREDFRTECGQELTKWLFLSPAVVACSQMPTWVFRIKIPGVADSLME